MPWLPRFFRRPARHDDQDSEIPDAWRRLLPRGVHFYRRLPRAQLPALHSLIRQFVAEKEFWGCNRLVVDDDMRVVIAAQAGLLVVGRPDLGCYPRVREIIIYPSEFGEITDAIGPDGTTYHIRDTRVGEASRRGPIILAWDSVYCSTADPADGHNTVYHEFAHALDFLDGEANGAPPLDNADQAAEWNRVFSAEFASLQSAVASGRRTTLDPYGAANPAEFFAVATEHFFEQPWRLRRNHAALYAQLRSFYRQDPASWA